MNLDEKLKMCEQKHKSQIEEYRAKYLKLLRADEEITKNECGNWSIDVAKIGLYKQRLYYSWPNISVDEFDGSSISNTIMLRVTNVDNFTPNTIYFPTDSYEIENINEEFQRQFKKLTTTIDTIIMCGDEKTLRTVVEITDPKYVIDISKSSQRTVLGWPDKTDVEKYTDVPEIILDPENPNNSVLNDYRDGVYGFDRVEIVENSQNDPIR
ncbi:hypothetical protein CHS0354_026045 [Potamilus streckersoni]|uniref:Uncharacterized protein n=1 Tax=Potamilus streckersoni TaxID=2493646 RepID=A0AAE0SMJ6_9BIVA|nr:hypothetical protein CHS0354_026045 [Potamilus streckersoni]